MSVYEEIQQERKVQYSKWGPEHDDEYTTVEWAEEIGARNHCAAFPRRRQHLLQIAALVVAEIESIDRKQAATRPPTARDTTVSED